MASDLAALRVNLEMQTAAFERGMGKVSRQLNQTERRFQSIQRSARNFGIAIAAAFSVQRIRGVIEFADNLSKMSRTLGLTTDQFQAYSFAAERAGIAAGQFESNMTAFVKRVGEAQAGMGPLVSGLKNLNAGLLESVKNARDQNEAFNLIADAVQNAGSATEAAAIANAAFSRSGVQMVEMLRGGSEGLTEMREEAQRLGLILDSKLARSAEQFNDQLTNLSTRLQVAFGTLVLQNILQFQKGIKALVTDMTAIKDAFVATWKASDLFKNQVVGIAAVISAKLIPVISALGVALYRLALRNPFTALALGAVMVVKHWEQVSAFFRYKLPAAWQTMKAAWYEVLAIMMDGMIEWGQSIIKRFEAIINGIIAGFNKLIQFSNTTFKTSFSEFGSVDLTSSMTNQLEDFELKVLEAVGAGYELDAAYSRAMQNIREEALKTEQAYSLFGQTVGEVNNEMAGDGRGMADLMMGDITATMQTAADKFRDLVNQAEAVRDALDPGRVIRREIEAMEVLLNANLITVEEYAARARQILEQGVTPTDNPIRTYVDEITDSISALNTKFADTLIQSLKDGENAFKAFASSAIEELARIMLSQAFQGLFSSFSGWAGGLFAPAGGGGGAPGPSSIPGAPGAFGLAGAAAGGSGRMTVGVLTAPTYGFGSGGHRSGIHVNVNNNAPVDVEVEQRRTSEGGVDIDILIEQKVNRALSNGSLDRTLSSSFGIARRAF